MTDLGVVAIQLGGLATFAFVTWQLRRASADTKLGLLAILLAMMFIGGFWTNERLDRLEARVGGIEVELDRWR